MWTHAELKHTVLWCSALPLTIHNVKCFTNSSRRFRREIMFENDTPSYTVFAPAELLRNWWNQRPSNLGDLDSSVTMGLREHYTSVWSMERRGGMIMTGKSRRSPRKPVPVPLCPPQIPHGLIRAWTRASAVRGRRLAAWAMARPVYTLVRDCFEAPLSIVHSV
jgi:hypothetical protein